MYAYIVNESCDFVIFISLAISCVNIDPIIVVLKLDLDIVKMHVCTKNEAHTFNGSKVIA